MILLLIFIAILAEELVRSNVFTLLQGIYLFILFLGIVMGLSFVSKKMTTVYLVPSAFQV